MNKILNLIKQYNVERLQFVNDGMNKNYINQYVNHIYIINLKHNKIRRNYVVKLMEKYNINFELISVPKLNEQEYNIISENNKITLGEAGCYLSHMFCLNDAIIKDYSKIIIFEDDIILHKRFN
jgi:GR25 family glycosyltransferase involved in LPS biosynthesis